MSISLQRELELNDLCRRFRKDVITILHNIQTGHPGGSLSVCEILTVLYLEIARIDSLNPDMFDRDRIVLTKGHAAPMLYRILAEKGFFPINDLDSLRQINSNLQGHPCMRSTPGIELSTGPLGIGLSACVGMALGLKNEKSDSRVYAIIGDGEINEGIIWEAAMSANKYCADNLTIIVDNNGVQLDGSNDEIMPLGDIGEKFKSFGLAAYYCDGHNLIDLYNTINQANNDNRPAVIVAKTVKGKGISFMEGKSTWHGSPITDDEYNIAMLELEAK